MERLRPHIPILVILATCAALRLAPLSGYDFTYDELSAIERTHFGTFGELISQGVKPDAHPALLQVFIFIVTYAFGYSEAVLKLPFILLSLAGILYAYRFGIRFFSREAGIFASLLLGFSLVFVYYSPVARMYAPGVFFSIALLYHAFGIAAGDGRISRDLAGFTVFCALSAYNHHLNALFALTVAVAVIFIMPRARRSGYLLACAAAVLLYAPHLPITFHQLGHGIGAAEGGWLEAPRPFVAADFIRLLFGGGYAWLVPLGAFLIFFTLPSASAHAKKRGVLFALFIVNYAVIHLYSVLRSPIYQHSVMLFGGSALVLFAASWFDARRIVMPVLAATGIALLAQTYLVKDYIHQCVDTGFDYQFRRTAELKAAGDAGKIFPLLFDADRHMKRHYFAKYKTAFDCRTTEDSIMAQANRKFDDGSTSIRRFSEFIHASQADLVVLSGAMPLHEEIVRQRFPHLTESRQSHLISYRVFGKHRQSRAIAGDRRKMLSSTGSPGTFTYSAGGVAPADSANEFPFAARAAYPELRLSEGQVLMVRCEVRSDAQPADLEVCIAVNNGQNESLMYAAKSAADFVRTNDSTLVILSDLFIGAGHRKAGRNSAITCFIWNRAKKPFKLLDFRIEVVDYWPEKWNYLK